MALYTGFDLHSTNTYVGIIDEDGKRIWKKKLRNDPNLILAALNPYKEDIAGVVVESTFNWYWEVDLLIEGDTRCIWPIPLGSSSIQDSSMEMTSMMRSGLQRC
jgi:hypothetical protein